MFIGSVVMIRLNVRSNVSYGRVTWTLGLLLSSCMLLPAGEVETILAPKPVITDGAEQAIFPGSSRTSNIWGPTITQFSVPMYRPQFPNCPTPVPTWDAVSGSVNSDDACASCESDCIPSLGIREATWYVSAALVPLRRDPQHRVNFARQGNAANSPFVLSSQSFDYPFDAGIYFTLGRRLTDRLAVEGSYLGSHSWRDTRFVRNADANTQGGTGNLFSPFTNFGAPAAVGLDFNNFVLAETTASFESAEINLRYRGEMPSGPWDVSFLYGVRYLHIGETLRYHSESAFPAVQGTQNTETVVADNDMIGAQLGLSGHYLYTQRSWFDVDLKGAIYSNQARSETQYDVLDNTGTPRVSIPLAADLILPLVAMCD